MRSLLEGFVLAAGAATCFGLQYVPVKKYEIYDGSTFQWFMCSGILLGGYVVALFFGTAANGCPLPIVFGGVLWSLSNYAVLPLVRLLGIGLGFSLYHFVNLVVGYLSGRFGWFGLARLQGDLLWACDIGCALICVSFSIMVLVEDHPAEDTAQDEAALLAAEAEAGRTPQPAGEADTAPLEPPRFRDINEEYRKMYHQWRRGNYRGSKDAVPEVERELLPRSNSDTHLHALAANHSTHISTFGGFSAITLRSPSNVHEGGSESTPDDASSQPGGSGAARRFGRRFLGVGLAIVGGGLCGVQAIPSTLYMARHPALPHTAVVYPQCMGVWFGATLIYICYAAIARLMEWRVPHSSIRPAFISGCMWAVGFTMMISGIAQLGYSVGYTLDAVGPIMISSLLSIFVFKEISGKRQLSLYCLALSLQLTGTLLIATFGSP